MQPAPQTTHQTLTEVLASEGITHAPGAIIYCRDLFDVEGGFLGSFNAQDAWEIINARGGLTITDAFRTRRAA